MAYLHYQRDEGEQDVLVTFDATERDDHVSSAIVSEHPVELGGNVTDHVRSENDTVSLDVVISNTPFRTQGFDENNPDYSQMGGSQQSRANADIQYPNTRSRVRVGGPRLVVQGQSQKAARDLAPGLGVALGFGVPGFGASAASIASSVPIIPAIKPQWEAAAEFTRTPPSGQPQTEQFSKPFDRARAVYDELRDIKSRGQVVTLYTSLRVYESMVIESIQTHRDATLGSAIRCTIDMRQIRVVSSQTVQVTTPLEPRGAKQVNRGKAPATEPKPEVAAAITSRHNENTIAAGILGL